MESNGQPTPKQAYDKARYQKYKKQRRQHNLALRVRIGEEAWKERTRGYGRKYETGVAPEVWVSLREAQQGRCGICSFKMNQIKNHLGQECADHDHQTGRARGLLCRACNLALGQYEGHQRPAGLRVPAYEDYLASSRA